MFIHRPITTAEQVKSVLASAKVEDDHHDWKATWSTKGTRVETEREAVKDVAAFLNAEGGTILLGITENNETAAASGIFSEFVLKGAREQLLDWLRRWLLPEGAAEHVVVHEFPRVGSESGASGAVMAINVAPWPHGPVAVRDGTHGDRFRVPVRRDRETREMSWERVMDRTASGNRAMYVRLRAHKDRGARHVLIQSPVEVVFGDRLVPVFPEADGRFGHGRIVDVHPDALEPAFRRASI